jgi:hypothetical protein
MSTGMRSIHDTLYFLSRLFVAAIICDTLVSNVSIKEWLTKFE